MGAIASGGVRILNEDVVRPLRIPGEVIDAVAAEESAGIKSPRARVPRGPPQSRCAARRVILIDDGLATGSTMRAAVDACSRLR
jgi:putative phosphoribosyl transferase